VCNAAATGRLADPEWIPPEAQDVEAGDGRGTLREFAVGVRHEPLRPGPRGQLPHEQERLPFAAAEFAGEVDVGDLNRYRGGFSNVNDRS
jgi:hypothetical protein